MITKKFEPSLKNIEWSGDEFILIVQVTTDRTHHQVRQYRDFATLEVKSLYPAQGREYTPYQRGRIETLCDYYAPTAKSFISKWLELHHFPNAEQDKTDVRLVMTPEGKVRNFYFSDWNKY